MITGEVISGWFNARFGRTSRAWHSTTATKNSGLGQPWSKLTKSSTNDRPQVSSITTDPMLRPALPSICISMTLPRDRHKGAVDPWLTQTPILDVSLVLSPGRSDDGDDDHSKLGRSMYNPLISICNVPIHSKRDPPTSLLPPSAHDPRPFFNELVAE